MNRPVPLLGCLVVAAGAICIAGDPLNAQPTRYPPRSQPQRNPPRPDNRKPERNNPRSDNGHVEGKLASIAGGGRGTDLPITGLAVVDAKNKRWNFAFSVDSDLGIQNSRISGKSARSFFINGVSVSVDWAQQRNATTGGAAGLFAERVRIKSEAIEGTITLMSADRMTVMATPRQRETNERPASETNARGRKPEKRQSRNTDRKNETTTPKSLKLSLVKDATSCTLDGSDATLAEVLAAFKSKRALQFDAIVVPGGNNPVVELHARTDVDRESEKGNKRTARGVKENR